MHSAVRMPHYGKIFFILSAFSLVFFYVIYTSYLNTLRNNLQVSQSLPPSDKILIDKYVVNSSEFDVYSEYLIANDVAAKKFYKNRERWKTSRLGGIMFKNEPFPVLDREQANKTYLILIYKQWEFLQNRHVYNFGETRTDPLGDCSVKNCIFTGNSSDLKTADAVIVHLFPTGAIPETKDRKPQQIWIFLDDEAPRRKIMVSRVVEISEMHNLFNWSMTYRTISDIPVPYGRTLPLKVSKGGEYLTDLIPNWSIKRTDVLAAILISNCAVPYRNRTITSMQKYLKNQFHVYGKCGDPELQKRCPGHFKEDCEAMSTYLFYVVLENSKCKEYITEKIFYHAYSKGSIPIIQGPSIQDCQELLPPNSFLHFDNFTSIEELVKKTKEISLNNTQLLYYHQWRYNFKVHNEHGYFGSKSYHLCRACEAMNYNDKKTSVYSEEDLKMYLDEYRLCSSDENYKYFT